MTRRPNEPRFARLRSGPCIRCLVFIGAITIPLGIIAAFAFGDVPPHYDPPRGYEPCNTVRC